MEIRQRLLEGRSRREPGLDPGLRRVGWTV